MDFSTLTSAVDLSTVGTAIIAVAALMVVPAAIKWGSKKIISFFG
jgi:hypothetical protein